MKRSGSSPRLPPKTFSRSPKQERDQILAGLEFLYESGLVSTRKFYAEKLAIVKANINDELKLLNIARAEPARVARSGEGRRKGHDTNEDQRGS